MRILLDTHIALWALANTNKLSEDVIRILESKDNQIYYSIASVWEIAIKHKIKPVEMPMDEQDFVNLCEQVGFEALPILKEHIFMLRSLERPITAKKHNDPFDRMLIAQAKTENIVFMTHDSLLPDYNEDCIMSV